MRDTERRSFWLFFLHRRRVLVVISILKGLGRTALIFIGSRNVEPLFEYPHASL